MPAHMNSDDALSAHQRLAIERIERDKTLDAIGKTIAIARVKGEAFAYVPDALVSSETRRVLRTPFPKVKFAVRNHRGYFISVERIDGPSVREAEGVISAFALEDADPPDPPLIPHRRDQEFAIASTERFSTISAHSGRSAHVRA